MFMLLRVTLLVMHPFDLFWANAVAFLWDLPLVILLTGAGVVFTIMGGFMPLRGFRHAIDILRGRFDNPNDPGEISHFQALSSALSSTIGMGNIAGVAIAVAVGGPGAIFWMWVSGLVGMSTKFFTCTLACMYRKNDPHGVPQGGPMYYIEVGLGRKFLPVAWMFAIFGMVGTLPLFQSNQLAGLLDTHWDVDRLVTGTIAMLVVGSIILGGIKRVGRTASKVVPTMCLLYLVACLIVVTSNYARVPALFVSIFEHAFGLGAAFGAATGVAVKQVLITGIQRAAFSNEAGMGTAPLAHGAAKTDEPVREGLVAMLGPFIDTHIICTLTALVILLSGVSTDGGGIVMTTAAFEAAMPGIGRPLLTVVAVLFALTTMTSLCYYGQKCARYLLGQRFGDLYILFYLLIIPVAAHWTQATAVNIADVAFALMAIPTLIGALLLSPKVVSAYRDYFNRMGSDPGSDPEII
jgi:AGCS family alanine or glycine:cation symporter